MITTEGTAAPSAERSKRHTTTSKQTSHFGNLIHAAPCHAGAAPLFGRYDMDRAEMIIDILKMLDKLNLISDDSGIQHIYEAVSAALRPVLSECQSTLSDHAD